MASGTEQQQILDIKVRYEDAINGIIKYKDNIDQLKAAIKELKQQEKDGTISTKEAKQQTEAISASIKEYQYNVRTLQKEIQNNIRQEQQQEGSLKQLRAELSNATKAFDELSRSEREGAKGKALQKHINDITNELKEAEEATQRFYRNVGNYEGAINNAIFGNSQFGQSLKGIVDMAGSGKGMSGIMTELTSKTKAFGSAVVSMVSNPYFLALAGVAGAGMAFKWFYDYNKGLLEATRLTKEFLGVSGDTLKAIRNEIQATADAYGKDFKETLEGVDALMSQYKLSASEALQVMNDGFASGADLNGDMIAKIQQYAPAFHDAGIQASELVAILQQTRSGIFSDKGLDLISMASKRIREMSTSTASSLDAIGISSKQVQKDLADGSKNIFQVIQEISAKLQTLPGESQEVGAVLKDVFGKQGAAGGLEMIKSLADMTTSLEEVKKQTGEWGEIMEAQKTATAELNNAMSALFDISDNGFEGMIASVKLLATKWLTSLLKGTINLINYFIDLYNNSTLIRGGIQSMIFQFKALWNTCKLIFNLIVDGLKSVGRQLMGLVDILEGAITLDVDKMAKGVKEIMSNGAKTFKEVATDFKNWGYDTGKAYIDSLNNTLKNAKIAHIEIPKLDAAGADAATTTTATGTTANNGGSGKGGKSSKTSKTSSGTSTTEQAKKEQEELRKAEDLLSQLIVQTMEQRREQIARLYDRQIEDLQKRLETEKNLTITAKQAINVQIQALTQIRNKKISELEVTARDEDIKREQTYIEMRLAVVKKGSDDAYQLTMSKIENERQLALDAANQEVVSEEDRQRNILLINQKYNKMIEDADAEHQNLLIQQQTDAIKKQYEQKMLQSSVDNNGNDEITQLQLDMEMKQQLLEQAQQMEGESIEAFNARKLQLEKDYQASKKTLADKEVEIEKTKADAIAGCIGGVQQVAEAFSSQSKAMAKASKVLALAEIAINTGVALAQGIKQAQSVPFPANIAAIATTVTTILANVASAVKTVQGAKFATGGLVQGEGTGTSDSIPARLSNGESVMTAQATSMFSPILSAFNQLGGGVPIVVNGGQSQMGMDMLAAAVAQGYMMAPRPVVSVEEITQTQQRVETIENIGKI